MAPMPYREGLEGVFCRQCEPRPDGGRIYYVRASSSEVASCKPCRDMMALTIGTLVAGVVVALLLARAALWLYTKHVPMQSRTQLEATWTRFGIQNKVKILISFFVILVISLQGSAHGDVIECLKNPLVSIVLLLVILSGVYHMKLGMQVIIEDYVHGEGLKVLSLMANTFFSVFIGLGCIFAVLKIGFGG